MKRLSTALILGFLLFSCTQNPTPETMAVAPVAGNALDRTVLPIIEPARPTYSELDARKATPPARWEVKAPKGAPNVVVILIDDMGFGVSEAFGGPVTTPTMDKLADNGFKV